jgi:agmatinase
MSFAGIPEKYASFNDAKILLQSIPYDGTSTWGKGADKGFERFLEATENMELYDIETDTEVYKNGIHVLPEIQEKSTPEKVYKAVYHNTLRIIQSGKFPTFFGGEHSISIGIIQAFYETYPDITILQLDAHADLRPEYNGSAYNHACALYDASRNANLIQVGIRSMDRAELEFMNKNNCFFAQDILGNPDWVDRALGIMKDKVYITLDLDVFDPGIMPSTGTPEPGGLSWEATMQFLKRVFELKDVKGFDIVELAPIENLKAPDFLVAKLYYKMLSYKFKYNES